MNRILLIAAIVLGFFCAGGMGRIIDARKSAERNDRAKDITATVNKGIDAARLLLDERHYQALARDYIDVPPEWRQKNWSQGGGSCVYATAISACRWQGKMKEADEIKRTCGGGSDEQTVSRKLKALGLKVVWTSDGDERLLDWAIKTRRGCGVCYHGHCTLLVGHENGQAIILDNNHVDRMTRLPWNDFIRQWKSCGGAFAIVGTPPPPTPK